MSKNLFTNKFLYIFALILFLVIKAYNGTLKNVGDDLRFIPGFVLGEAIGFILISFLLISLFSFIKSKLSK